MRDKDESSSQINGKEGSSEQVHPSLETGRADAVDIPKTDLDVNVDEESEVLVSDDNGNPMDIDE